MQFVLHSPIFYAKKECITIDIEKLKKEYDDKDVVKLVNPKQTLFYMKNGVYPLWLEVGYNDRIVFVFLKEPTLRLFKQWREFDTGWKNK